MENYCWKQNYVYALVTIYKTILHYHRCFRYWSSLYLVNKNMDCWVEINIKLDIFLDSICCLQHTWKEGYGNDCLCFVFNFFLNYYPCPLPQSLGPATTYSWKSIDPTKIICKQNLCIVLVCTGPSPQINIARSLTDPTEFLWFLFFLRDNQIWFNTQKFHILIMLFFFL